MKNKGLFSLFLIFKFIQPCLNQKLELIQANVLWRHGDRAPLFTYDGDLVPEPEWGAPYGELTELGMEQAYTKGLILKKRYVSDFKLISPVYNSSQVYVRSTNMDRALLSAYAVMAGIYSTENTNSSITSIHKLPSKWTSVPVHSDNFKTDYLLNMERECPKFLAIDKQRNENPEFQKYVRSIEPLFQLVRNNTGLPVPDVFQLRLLEDALKIAKEKNKPLPEWITDSVYKMMDEVLNNTDDYKTGYPGFGLPIDMDMIKLRGGPLLKEMIDNMQKIINETEGSKKLKLYSGHDITVSSLMRNLNAKIQTMGQGLPNYTAAVAIELWKSENADFNFINMHDENLENSEYFVQVLFSANPTDDFHPVTRFVSGCPSSSDFCPLTMFINRSKAFIPDDIIKLCNDV